MFYATSYGVFLRIYNNILNKYRYNFVNEIYFNETNQTFTKRCELLKKYFEAIQQIRNRAAHSNHFINRKMTDKLSKIYLDCFDENCKKYNKFERTLYFLYIKSENSEQYKKDIIKCLKKYQKYLSYCIQKDIFRPNIIDRIEEDWIKLN